MKTIEGSETITMTNYEHTHGCENFKRYAESLGAEFLARKDSGVYVIRANTRTVTALASFAGFDAANIEQPDVWCVRRCNVRIVDATC